MQRAAIINFQTSQGVYDETETGAATLSVYGNGSTRVMVERSDGTSVYSETLSLNGYCDLVFGIPTDEPGTEVLDATVIGDGQGIATDRATYAVNGGMGVVYLPLVVR